MKPSPQKAVSRAPVVVIMGHIDHGKSTLLDYIRKTKVTEDEAGGITQHISAYEVNWKHDDGRPAPITFLDTPGHEAFQGHRKRGAGVADIGVLVVSAEEGVKPQTLEAYKYIKDISLPFIVAITKIDRPSADIDRTKQSLAEHEIFVEGYGGDIPVIALSSKTGNGVDDLLDMIVLMSELEHYTGMRDRLACGIIIESKMDPKKGITAVGIIQDGTLRKGQVAAAVGATAPVRLILDAEGNQIDEATFSSPVQIIGWDKVPPVGSRFEIFDDKKQAEFYADSEAAKERGRRKSPLQNPEALALPLIIKADTTGSLEATIYEVEKPVHERIMPRVNLSGVGSINENDVKAAQASGSYILGFNVKADREAMALAERSAITIQTFDIIYKLAEFVESLLKEKEPRVEVEEVRGSAKVLKLFSVTKDKYVLGARMGSGTFENGNRVRIVRREEILGEGKVKELQQSKVKVENISGETEFGAMIESKIEIAPGDILECVATVTK